jgi:hypothetical protein
LPSSCLRLEGVSNLGIHQISDGYSEDIWLISFLVRTLCRVFTTLDTRPGYHRLFKRVYQLLERITGSRPLIRVIDGGGLDVVVADTCAKQYFGRLFRYPLDI